MTARIIEVCDAVVARLQAVWAAQSPPMTATAERSYGLDDVDPNKLPAGVPLVRVFPTAYGRADLLTRAGDVKTRDVSLVVLCRAPTLPPAKAWVDAQLAFVDGLVYGPLQDVRAVPALPDPCTNLYPDAASVVEVFDPDSLRAAGLFVSEIAVNYREYA